MTMTTILLMVSMTMMIIIISRNDNDHVLKLFRLLMQLPERFSLTLGAFKCTLNGNRKK